MPSAHDTSSGEGITIQQAERADLLAVFRIEKVVFSQPWPFATFEKFVGEPGFLVATRDEAVVGYAVSDVMPNHGRNIGHLKDIAVHPQVQGEGIGRALLEQVLFTLSVEGAHVVKLEVRERNEAAQSLYDDVGFEGVRRIPGYYDDGEDAYVMVLDLTDWHSSR